MDDLYSKNEVHPDFRLLPDIEINDNDSEEDNFEEELAFQAELRRINDPESGVDSDCEILD